ncbi:surface-adhesin E family protein [Burkholderia ubonensis]|uniref:surface-adhesin E family protein n=1 Tax=Burkholderia ubonensis TaxID=101571 RepID=UPI0012F82E02|nr:surface-adhesin E family protein [Burkholderia ubonensis]
MNRKKIIATLLAAGILVSPALFASDWRYLSSTENTTVSLDVQSVHFKGAVAKAWILSDYDPPTTLQRGYTSLSASSSKALYFFDCDSDTSAVAEYVYASGKGGNGAVVESWNIPSSQRLEFSEVVPDSIGEAMLRAVCNMRPKPRKKPM